MKRDKIIQIIQVFAVIFFMIAAFYLGRISMEKEFNVLFERVHQLEIEISEIQSEY